jgi:hypothetical protein
MRTPVSPINASPCWLIAALACAAAVGCADDPQYVQPLQAIEVGAPGTDITDATASITLPIRLEEDTEAMERAELMAELGVQVPFVGIDDISVSVEWTLKNLEDNPGQARVHLNGGNEWFIYVPLNFVIDPEEDEEPPSMQGDIPIDVPAGGTVNGVFREDQLREAAVDLELITRGPGNPFAAILQNHSDLTEITDMAGAVIPEQAFAHLIQLDLRLESTRHMVLEYAVRVRDHEGILHELLLDAPAAELTAFAPVPFVPPAPVP